MVLFLVELNTDILVSFTLPFTEKCHSNLMAQSLAHRRDIHSNLSFVPLLAKCAGCFSPARAYVHNFNFAGSWCEFMSNARG